MNDLIYEVNAEHDAAQAKLESIKTSAPDLSSGAMLSLLNISVWEGRKTDRNASEKLANDNGLAKKKMASVQKSLVDSDELTAIKKLRGVARNHVHYHLTQPWSDSGLRLLTTKAYFHYENQMSELRNEFWKLAQQFFDTYSLEVAKAQVDLGPLFNANDYPTLDEIKDKFRFDYTYMPLPSSGDFRVDIGHEQREHLAEEYNKFYQQQFNTAMRDVWERLMQPLANMVERLDYTEDETAKRFHSSLVDNVLAITEVMDMVNINNDPDMAAVSTGLQDALRGVTAEALRDDEYLRGQTRKVAADALKETKKALDSIPSLFD